MPDFDLKSLIGVDVTTLFPGTNPWYIQPLGLHLIVAALMLWPLMRMLWRAGLSPVWGLLVFVPVLGLPLVGSVLAFTSWPLLAKREGYLEAQQLPKDMPVRRFGSRR